MNGGCRLFFCENREVGVGWWFGESIIGDFVGRMVVGYVMVGIIVEYGVVFFFIGIIGEGFW